jgi:class 3 adenylate cyclase/TolB-like protein
MHLEGPDPTPPPALDLPRSQKVVLVMDLVESVRLMAANESSVIARWRGFVDHARKEVLPSCRGRLVKSLGDGIMAEFDTAPDAAAAALALHRHFEPGNQRLPPAERLYLRAGLNACNVYVDELDIYGTGVNLAARVAALAGAGETMVTAEVRDGLDDGLDVQTQDMGECFLKHVAEPVRAFRIGAAGPGPLLMAEPERPVSLRPTVAVIPFAARSAAAEHFAIGELIADGVIAQLGKTAELAVISRLATTALRDRALSPEAAQSHLGADYVLSGSYVALAAQLLVNAELVDVRRHEVIWSERLQGSIEDLLQPASELCHALSAAAHDRILGHAVQRAMYCPLPSLAGQSLMFSGIAGLHQASRASFAFSGQALAATIERYPRHGEAHAWLAKWHAIGTSRALLGPESRQLAIHHAERAVQAAPDSPFALTVAGLVKGYFLRDAAAAATCYDRALALNPNEMLAWLYRSNLAAWGGEGAAAADAARRALKLAPVGSLLYYVQSLAGLPLLVAGDADGAIAVLRNSLRLNTTYPNTLRVLTMALAARGDLAGASTVAADLLRLEPGFNVDVFRRRYPGRAHPHVESLADLLLAAGVPAH